jgi:hypothetical protein
MTLFVTTHVDKVSLVLPSPGGVDAYVLRRAGVRDPLIVLEAYDAGGLVAGGEVVVWELNQAIAAFTAPSAQARRIALRDDGRGHHGHLDVVCDDAGAVQLVATARTGRRAAYATTNRAVAADLNAVLHHYLVQTRSPATRTIVLPEVRSSGSRWAEAAEQAPASGVTTSR